MAHVERGLMDRVSTFASGPGTTERHTIKLGG